MPTIVLFLCAFIAPIFLIIVGFREANIWLRFICFLLGVIGFAILIVLIGCDIVYTTEILK